ncbi:uncharacterized protein ACN63O_009930 [Diretmus argenteus]
MSDTPLQEPPALSSGSVPTLASRPLQPISDPSASKRVCFYKSGDHTFSGHRMVINTRTFKTFDALLDALSKKVPLPFGVRTITTPRGIHLVKGLDGFHDGGSYVCSDQKRVKPLNLDAVHQRQVPWNTTRPVSAGQRGHHGFPFGQFGRRNEAITRPAKRVALRTPKRLVVIKNRDPAVKRTIVLQRRTAPTFDALLDYLSQVMQFPVLKLYSADGRRVDGLAALILCSGVIVAAGNEPFRLGNHNVHRTAQMAQSIYPSALQPQHQQKKSFSSGRGSRNFSLSSERFIVNQINKSRNGSTNSHVHRRTASFETEVNHNPTSVDMESCDTVRVDDGRHTRILPQDDDIEKSFRVNQDGSMTVEMKVRLNIKEEELLHWTTTLSRSSLSQRTVCASKSESGNSPPDSDTTMAKDPSGISEDTPKDENHPTGIGNGVGRSDEQIHEGSPAALEKSKSRFKRTPTPGPRHARKRASVESIKMMTESGVQESTLGQYSYVERSETTEEYCVVRHISSSSNRPVPKPRKTASAGASKGSHSIRSGVAEIQNNGMEITETVMHISETQGCYDNYFYVENWLQEVHPGSVPYTQETITEESEPQTKVVFQIGGDSEAKSECQTNTDDAAAADAQSRLRTNKSAEAFGPVDNESSTSNLLSPKAQITPVLQQLCSSLQCIRRASESKEPSDREKSSSLPDFSTHVASVFGSSPKAFLSFLSVMTLRDTLTGSVARDSCGSRTASEAMLVMESLQKISTIEDEEEQRASLTDLQSRTSSQLKGHWRDFQVLRERLESEPLSPKFSEQEFALDVISEDGGDAFDDQHLHIDELMEELNMPRDLREAISSTLQQSKRFYPEVEESTCVEKEIHCSDSEEEREHLVKKQEAKQSPEPDTNCTAETIAETSVKENNENGEVPAGESDSFNKMQSEEEREKCLEIGPDVKKSETGRTEMETEEKVEPSKHPEPCLEVDICEEQEDKEGIGDEYKEGGRGKREGKEKEKQVEEVEEYGKEVKDREDGNTKDVEETMEEERQEKEGSEMREEFEEPDEKEEEGREEETIVSGEEEEEKEELEERESEVEGEEEWKGAEVEETDAKQHKVVETEAEEVTKKDEEEEWEDVEEERENRDADAKEREEEMKEKKEEVEENSEEKDEGVEVTEVIEIGEEEDVEEVIEIGEEEEDIDEKEEEVEEGGGGEANEKDTDINEVEQSRDEEEEEEEVSVEEQELEEREEREDEVDTEAVQEVESCEGEAEEETEESEEKQELNDGYKQVEERELKEENLRFREHVTAAADGTKAGKRLLEETDCLQQQSSCEEANADTKGREHEVESSIRSSSRGQCEDGTDTVKDLKTDDGEEGNNSLLYPVGISQELLDFVNSALRSSSLIFTYDARGNVKIEPENARVVQTKRIMIPKSREGSLYGLKRLPSPSTSDLSDYRPETSESGGYNTLQSIDIASDSEEGPSERESPNHRHTRHTNMERTNSKLSRRSPSELSQSPRLNSGGSFSSYDSRTKASREDLSYFSSASSLKAGMESVIKAAQCFSIASEVDSNDGVLIDQGRWLLKENHLIRKSPPVPIGMYGELDTTSIDTYQESEGSPKHYVTQNNPLAVISSSDLEEMAKPPTPKCTYYIMSHGSDSDPFLDDVSVTSGKKGKSNGKGKGLRVSPTTDTTRSWPKKNGSISSFASVEFKLPDNRVHPEGDESSSAVTQPRRPSSVRRRVLQDSLDTLHVRCGQYCPIL